MPPAAAAAPKKKRPGDEAKKAIEATRKKLKEPEASCVCVCVCVTGVVWHSERGWGGDGGRGRPGAHETPLMPKPMRMPTLKPTPHRQEILKYVRKLAKGVKKEPLVSR